MKPSQDTYPVFEVNQVLTSSHLNELFRYLDEQERLTRANLIGIGIVCGLEISSDQGTGEIFLTRGCGVTSEGYLIVEPDDVTLVSFKPYTLPTEPPYPPFMNGTAQFQLWELFPTAEQGATLLKDAQDFMKGKAVLLFLELKKESLRNCSLNDCDDRGSDVALTLRRLLIDRGDLDQVIAQANQLPNVTGTEPGGTHIAELNLPDLRLPRFDVPNTVPVTAQQVLAAFLSTFTSDQIVHQTAAALSAAYNAFLPLLQKKYPSDPFSGFLNRFGFLDSVPATTSQVRFLQYYYDFFDDLLDAYYEFRCKGIDLACACCPPEGLFPRHLMLGLLFPAEVNNPGIYRNYFLASPAIGACLDRTRDLQQLFDRLVEMVRSFTEQPPLPKSGIFARNFVPVRITPSRLGCAPLSEKAIPYYYLEDGTPPLYQLWNPKRTRTNRANQNLSFRWDDYVPDPPSFVSNPLRYDLEPYNFLRIEGHLGLSYPRVLSFLLSLKARFRLPIDIVALRAGAFDENLPVDLSKEDCHFQDLESLYATLKAELICFLCKEVQYFYVLPFNFQSPVTTPAAPKLPLLLACAPGLQVQPKTFGRFFEDYLASQHGVIPDIDPNVVIGFLGGRKFRSTKVISTQNPGDTVLAYLLGYIQKLADQLPDDLQQFDFPSFQKRYQDLVVVAEAVETARDKSANAAPSGVSPTWEEIDDRLEEIVFRCRLESFAALIEEFQRRVRQVKEKQFLSLFLRDHPGIQHKGGVPMGGTFILVYHASPAPVTGGTGLSGGINVIRTGNLINRMARSSAESAVLSETIDRISADRTLTANPDLRFLLGSLAGKGDLFGTGRTPIGGTNLIIDKAVSEIDDGTVIADFYLPYLCCSDCTPIQFVLPKLPPTFTLQIDCTDANGEAKVTLKPEGGTEPYSVKVDNQDYQPLEGPLALKTGSHTIALRDSEGVDATPKTIQVPAQLTLGAPAYDCVGTGNQYVANFDITGGTAPYSASRGTVSGNTYSSDTLPGDTDIAIVITDSSGCSATANLRHSCLAPLSFAMDIGQTHQGVAPVKITPAGGAAPYQVQVDTDAPAPLVDGIELKVGSYSITLHDSAGNVTAPQTAVIPPELVLTESGFTCEGTTSYRSTVAISGGTQPYSVNGNLIGGSTFVTQPIPNNGKSTVTVTDGKKWTASLDVQHSCDQPCNLPCGGDSIRCAYRLWLQSPEGGGYRLYTQDSPIKLVFNNKEIHLPDTSALLKITTGVLNSSFDKSMASCIRRLNKLLNSALIEALGPEGQGRLSISPVIVGTPQPFGIMQIEHFICDSFSLEFNYSFAKPDPAYNLTVRYSSDETFSGVTLINRGLNNKETRIPAFSCAQRNLCTQSAYKELCSGKVPKPVASFVKQGESFVFKGSVNNPGEVSVVAWVWEMLAAQPTEPLYEGEQVTASLQKPGGSVRLTAITQDGCYGRADTKIA